MAIEIKAAHVAFKRLLKSKPGLTWIYGLGIFCARESPFFTIHHSRKAGFEDAKPFV